MYYYTNSRYIREKVIEGCTEKFKTLFYFPSMTWLNGITNVQHHCAGDREAWRGVRSSRADEWRSCRVWAWIPSDMGERREYSKQVCNGHNSQTTPVVSALAWETGDMFPAWILPGSVSLHPSMGVPTRHSLGKVTWIRVYDKEGMWV